MPLYEYRQVSPPDRNNPRGHYSFFISVRAPRAPPATDSPPILLLNNTSNASNKRRRCQAAF